jgi:glyoxylase-like metal-dependent hydrolase (beta-lactamase superfamily II)
MFPRWLPRIVAFLLLALCVLPRARALEPVRVGDGVYVFFGDNGEISAANGGNVSNAGFIVGDGGVIVIDTGITYRHGRAMLEAIGRITDQPVKLVIITHAVQEFLFGNAAFVAPGVSFVTQARSAELMRQRCDHCLAALRKTLGEDALSGTRLVIPERTVEESTTLEVAGRTLDLFYFGWASTPGDLTVLDRKTGVLFAGGLVAAGRVPELRDGNFAGWLLALEQLARIPARIIVPGHGPAGGAAQTIKPTADYLRALDDKVRALYRSGVSLLDAVDAAALPAYSGWSMYPALHRQNVLHRYLQLELEELGGDAAQMR